MSGNIDWTSPGEILPPPRRTGRRSQKRREAVAGYLFILPNILGFLAFVFLPVVFSFVLSFCKWDAISGIDTVRFVGLHNYWRLLGFTHTSDGLLANDPEFWKSLWNTVVLMLAIPVAVAGSLVLALLLNRSVRGRILFRTTYFLPSICVPVAVFLMWRWLYQPDFGLVNWLLALVGIKGPDWLGTITWAKPAIIVASIWASVGGPNMILYLAGLQGIPSHLYEAAELDGATKWQMFRHITWPLLSPTTFFILIMSTIAGFQGNFESAYMMTGGGPAGSTTALSYYIYNNAFRWFNMGYAAAIAWVLFLIVFLATFVNFRYGSRRVHY